ncbi:MAG: LuxR C-terminal-related transcriptional regulator, partial [Bacillota bacterium]|nr:LuxR C-terminal-related transcriptional regulator [Bacillota bacterium]
MEMKFLLKRKVLFEKHKNILDYPLVLGIASMGFGKTVSARNYLESNDIRHLWISIESKESSKEYIWDSITKQVSTTVPDLGKQLRALGFPQNGSVRDKVIKIIEDFTYLTETVLVFDDYHNLNSSEFDKLMERLVKKNIQGLHVLVLSRTVPSFNIDELELKGFCYRIRGIDYELNKGEIKEYFSENEIDLNNKEIDRIYKITEGWITAVYLIFKNYNKIGFIEYEKGIENLIKQTVMNRYDNKEIEILSILSILDKFTAEQAEYILENKGIKEVLYELSLENAFIRYDEKEKVYRFHNIFRNYIKKNTVLTSKNKINKYLKRMGKWYIENEDIMTGINFFLKIEEYSLVLEEFEKPRINIIFDNNQDFVLETFKLIPEKYKYEHLFSYLAYIGFYTTNIDSYEGLRLLDVFERNYLIDKKLEDKVKRQIKGEVELIKAYTEFNNPWNMRKRLKTANEILEGESRIADDQKIITFGSPHALYLYYCEKGKFKDIKKCVVEMFNYYTEIASGCGKGFDDLVEAEYYLETGDLDKSSIHSYKALYKAESLDQEEVIISAKYNLARTKILKGDFKEAEEILNELKDESNRGRTAILVSTYDLVISYIDNLMEKHDYLPDWIKNGEMDISQILYQGMGYNYLVYGKYLLKEKEYIKLDVLCDEMEEVFSTFGNVLGVIHKNILRSIAQSHLYNFEKAEEYMIRALNLGEADGLTTIFIEYRNSIIDILKRIEENYENKKYIKELILKTEKHIENLSDFINVKKDILKITKREKEVLELIVKGYTNKEISKELYIAEVTVRKNITSIYRKLNVNGRASAVRKSMNLE